MQRRISSRMNYPFDKYYREKCENCFNNRRCKKDKHAMLFCLLTNCFDQEPKSYKNKQVEKLIGTFRRDKEK